MDEEHLPCGSPQLTPLGGGMREKLVRVSGGGGCGVGEGQEGEDNDLQAELFGLPDLREKWELNAVVAK